MNDNEWSDMLEGARSNWMSKWNKEPKGSRNSKSNTRERN